MRRDPPQDAAPVPEGEGDKSSSVAKGGVQSLVYRVVELGSQGLMIIVTARLLQPEGRGFYALASLTAMLCIIPLGSVWYANAFELSRGRTTAPELLGASLVISFVGGSVTALAAFAIAPALGDRWWVVAFPAAVTPFLLLSRYGEGLFQALGRIHAVGLITVSRVVVPLIFISAALALGADDRVAIGVWTVSLVAVTLLLYPSLVRATGGQRLPADRRLYPRLTRFGLRLSPGMLALLGTPRMGLVVLAILEDPAVVGVYSVAIAVGEVLYLTTYSLITSAFQEVGSGERKAAIWLSARAVRHGVLLAVVGAVLITPATIVALPLVVGAGYEEVPVFLALLAPGIIAQAGAWTLSTFFTVHLGRPEIITRTSLVMTTLSLGLGFALVAVIGAEGAAIASSLASITGAVMLLRRFRAEAEVPIRALRPGLAELGDYRQMLDTALRRAQAGV